MNPSIYLNQAGQKEKAENLTISQYSSGNELRAYTAKRYEVVFAVFRQPNGSRSKQIHLSYQGYDSDLSKHLYSVEIPYSATCFAIATSTAKMGVSVHLWSYRDNLLDDEDVATTELTVSKAESSDQYDTAYSGADLDNLWRAVDKNAQDNYDNKQDLSKIKSGETVVPKAKYDENGKLIASQEYVAQRAYSKTESDAKYKTKEEATSEHNAIGTRIGNVESSVTAEATARETADSANLATAKSYADSKDVSLKNQIDALLATKADSSTIATELNAIKEEMGGIAVTYVFTQPEDIGLDSGNMPSTGTVNAIGKTDLNGLLLKDAKIGDDIRFTKVDVPDYWVYGKSGSTLYISILETEKFNTAPIVQAEQVRQANEATRIANETQRKANEVDRVARYNEMGVLKGQIEGDIITLNPIYNLFHNAGIVTKTQFDAMRESDKAGKIFFVKVAE